MEIIYHFAYNVILLLHFIAFLIYFIKFYIIELHIQPRLPIFYHNNTLLYCVSSLNFVDRVAQLV